MTFGSCWYRERRRLCRETRRCRNPPLLSLSLVFSEWSAHIPILLIAALSLVLKSVYYLCPLVALLARPSVAL
jgi:hypothetical protein